MTLLQGVPKLAIYAFRLRISKREKHLGIKSMGVPKTWLRVDIQNVQNFKDWSDIA